MFITTATTVLNPGYVLRAFGGVVILVIVITAKDIGHIVAEIVLNPLKEGRADYPEVVAKSAGWTDRSTQVAKIL